MSLVPRSAAESYVLSFREGVSITQRDEVAVVESPPHRVPLKRLSSGLLAALSSLSAGGATESAMASAVEANDGPAALPVLYYYLERFKSLGLVSFSAGSPALATLVTAAGKDGGRATPQLPDTESEYRLSRFACLRAVGDRIVVESPLSHSQVILHDPRVLQLYHALAVPRRVADLVELCPEAPAVLGLLVAYRAARLADEPEEPALAMWTFHDLFFHTRSRRGRNVEPFGATFRFAGRLGPLPVLKPPMTGPRIELFRPDVDVLKSEDISFTRVLEERRSNRAFGDRPIHIRQLGELLHRAARVRRLVAWSGPPGSPGYEASSRPYPGGGACYELEIYPVVRACEGLAEGLYHYEPADHALTALSGRTAALDVLLSEARASMGAAAPPQVLLVLGARFGRMMWKYESMAYAAILKDVGAFYQTVYLVATAMSLACCALGGGDSDRFAAAAGLDYFEETSVGEMALGSLAP